MPKQKIISSTAKIGINYIRDIVERANCIFHKIEQENDLGIDGLIEIIKKEEPTGNLLALQVKSGESYFNHKNNECLIQVANHREYWLNYRLPVYGVVYVPSLSKGYWVNIKEYLKINPDRNVIRFKKTEVNQFDQENFLSIFVPRVLSKIPNLEFKKAIALFHSKNRDEFYTGLVVLFRKYVNKTEVWDEFVDFFHNTKTENIPTALIYYFAHIPWHGDISAFGEMPTEDTISYVNMLFNKFDKEDNIKLLALVDEENLISRGSIGQSVEAIVSSLPNCLVLLKSILDDKTLPLHIRIVAAIVLSMHWPIETIPQLKSLELEGSWFAKELISYIQQWGAYNPY